MYGRETGKVCALCLSVYWKLLLIVSVNCKSLVWVWVPVCVEWVVDQGGVVSKVVGWVGLCVYPSSLCLFVPFLFDYRALEGQAIYFVDVCIAFIHQTVVFPF